MAKGVMAHLLLLCMAILTGLDAVQSESVRAAYWPAYAADEYPLSALNPRLYTHLIYAFAQMDSSTYAISPATGDNGAISSFASTLQSSNPKIKTLIAIGGGSSDSQAFSDMASSSSSRQAFINSSISLAVQYGFNGIDLDWEYPQSDQDMENLGTLFSEWRSAANLISSNFIITAAVYYSPSIKWVGGGSYPISSIKSNVDWVNIMTFDYHGSWEPNNTGAHTAVYDPSGGVSTDSGISKWLDAGLPSQQGVLGLAMYGRSWNLKNSSDHGIGAAAVGVPSDSTPTYSTIAKFITDNDATVVYDNSTITAYCYSQTSWIGFDNNLSIAGKVKYLKSKLLKGYFFWTSSYDDNKFTLSRTAAYAIGY